MRGPFGSKQNKTDYTVDMLPHNRREVFFDVLKLGWTRFVSYGMLVLLFSLPMLLFAWIEASHNYGIMQDSASLTEKELQTLYREMASMSNTRSVLDIFSFLLLSVCVSGLIRVIRQFAWGENVAFFSDFFTGIKQNFSQMALLGLLIGIVNAVSVYTFNYSALSGNGQLQWVFVMPACLAVLLGIPMAAYAVVCISIYNNRLIGNMKIGFLVFAKSPLKTYLSLICCFLPFAPQLIPNMYCNIFGRMAGCILTPVLMLAWFLFASNRLDEYVNKEHFPSLVGKGTFPAEEKQDSAA